MAGQLNEEELDELGQLADRLNAALAMAVVPLPPEIHIEGMRGTMSDVRDELRAFVVQRLGRDPWEFHP